MVPTGTGKQAKPGKMGMRFSVREKSGNFTQNTGKISINYTTKLEKKVLEKSGKFVSQDIERPTNMVPYFK